MKSNLKHSFLHFFRAFFPLQLLFGHIKYNLLSVFFWFILFSIASDSIGSAFGIPFLFYSPEYRGETGFISIALMGFAIGGFTMAFHTYSYMKLGKRYPFIATISNPFIKFCFNNSIIPLTFIIYFIYKLIEFQKVEEFASNYECLKFVFAFLFGFALFLLISFFYFFPRNKKIFSKMGIKPVDYDEDNEPISSFFHRTVNWQNYFKYKKDRTYLYMATLTKLKTSRSSKHYDKESLEKVFKQSKMSSSLFEFVTILTFFIIGIFRENPVFDLPAGMSIVMLLTIVMMIISALTSWFYYWTYPILILVFIIMNLLSKHTNLFQYKNFAYGLSYEDKKLVKYNLDEIDKASNDFVTINQSKRNYISILNQWKKNTGEKKPKLVIVMTSGGGSRSALWTYTVLEHLDSQLKNKLMIHSQMFTGASGGMIGAAYYRSLFLKKINNKEIDFENPKYKANIAKDLLNKLSFSAYSNDLLFRVQNFTLGKNTYTKDRAYSFERQLNGNTEGVFDVKLNYFTPYEEKAVIPTMIFSPTIVNDGRRLLISSQSLAFLCGNKGSSGNLTNMYENIDFQSYFKNNADVQFLSVLRMSATFPLVLPMVSMPTKPEMHIMDAGIRDNYGGKVTMEYLNALKEWIKENTSGVIILKIRDTKKILKGETVHKVSLLNKFTMPFGNMYDNFPRTQDFDQDELFKLGVQALEFPVDLVVFNLRENKKDRISLSWHLTSQEKMKIQKALSSKDNLLANQQILNLLK